MTKARRQFSPDEKLQMIQEARQGGMPVSAVCAKHGIYPKQFYQWEQQASQGALRALQPQKRGRKKVTPHEEELLAEVGRLQGVIAELSVENLQLKRGRWR
jgi:transposase-like protein